VEAVRLALLVTVGLRDTQDSVARQDILDSVESLVIQALAEFQVIQDSVAQAAILDTLELRALAATQGSLVNLGILDSASLSLNN
jgi:hypothetical protein